MNIVIKELNNGYVNAIANFNNKNDSEQLNNFFDKIKNYKGM